MMRKANRMAAALAAALLLAGGCAAPGPKPTTAEAPPTTPAAPPAPAAPAEPVAPPTVIDDFSTIAAWTAHPADGVKLKLASDAGALRLDFKFTGGGYAIARRDVDITLPENYAIAFKVRGQALPQSLELKLIDDTNENVWWHVRRDMTWPQQWEQLRSKKRQITFAWGPDGSRGLHHIKAIEFAVTAGSGGQGSVWLDDLQVVPLPVATGPVPPPTPMANSLVNKHGPEQAMDGNPATYWEAGRGTIGTTFTLEFTGEQEFGGLTVDWVPGHAPTEYLVEVDEGGGSWKPILQVKGSRSARDQLYLPESEAKRVRLRALVEGPEPAAISELKVQPLPWSATKEAFVMNIAKQARRGLYPRGFLGEPTGWTVVGRDFDTREGLIGKDGALEAGPGEFSLEPFLSTGGKLVTWNDAEVSQSLVNEVLPIPQVSWDKDNWRLTLTAAGAGEAEKSYMLARYRVENRSARTDTLRLYLAVRPMQVNPPSQFLNIRGGTAKVAQLEWQATERLVRVNGQPRVQVLTKPSGFAASSFFGGDIVADWLEHGKLPKATEASCVMNAASGALWWDLVVEAGGTRDVAVAVPLHGVLAPAQVDANAELITIIRDWQAKLDRVPLKAPRNLTPERAAVADEAIKSVKAQIGWILVNRAGPAIQPGTRSYARSWIRDGALTGEALMRMGFNDEARDFLQWFAPNQYENGKIPCVVDARGADPVPEHDSTGEFIYLVAQYWRHTHDRAVTEAMWPRVVRGVVYLESLLDQRRTAEYRAPDKAEFYGILPPSISHEGYSAKPMHSYWDDFFCLRGLKDAAWLASELQAAGVKGMAPEAKRLATLRDQFAADLQASVAAAMKAHGIDYVPGCADLGDFDATSTTIALDPCDAAALLPPGALDRTFEKYWTFFSERRDGAAWKDFTPYEVRCIGAFARLGREDEAWEMVEWFLSQRAVPGWKVWGEVVHRDKTEARFIGDMPHGWVGSDFVRSMWDLVGDGGR